MRLIRIPRNGGKIKFFEENRRVRARMLFSVIAYGVGISRKKALSVRSRWSRPAPPKGELFGIYR